MKEFILERSHYVKILEKWRKKHVIKVATGIRRAGKSSVFLMYEESLKKSGVSESNIIHLNLEDLTNAELLDYKKLYAYIKEKTAGTEDFYIFIDEVQQCPSFEKVLDSLFLDPRLDIYVTGSNAYFLSGELATLLSGRYVEVHIQPLSFEEYLLFNKKEPSINMKKNASFLESIFQGDSFRIFLFLMTMRKTTVLTWRAYSIRFL
ncbi:MAG: AAA family ATPase [Treponema sp.]|nr:AAA family ATPase [Treponema sp.]